MARSGSPLPRRRRTCQELRYTALLRLWSAAFFAIVIAKAGTAIFVASNPAAAVPNAIWTLDLWRTARYNRAQKRGNVNVLRHLVALRMIHSPSSLAPAHACQTRCLLYTLGGNLWAQNLGEQKISNKKSTGNVRKKPEALQMKVSRSTKNCIKRKWLYKACFGVFNSSNKTRTLADSTERKTASKD